MILEINGIDLSDYVNVRKHNINHKMEHGNTEWNDAWYIKHRAFTRRRITGTTYLSFIGDGYSQFLRAMSLVDPQAYHNVAVYVNSLDEEVFIQAYLSYTTSDAWIEKGFGGGVGAQGVTLTIEER